MKIKTALLNKRLVDTEYKLALLERWFEETPENDTIKRDVLSESIEKAKDDIFTLKTKLNMVEIYI